MAIKKPPHVNKPFDEATRETASQFIIAGKDFEGGFWKNRSLTSSRFGYTNWQAVPQQVRECINQIGKAASERGRKAKKKLAGVKPPEQVMTQAVLTPQTDDAFVPEHFLEDIYDGSMKIPRDTSVAQLRTIRVYITKRAGFDPEKVLLGVESRMEKSKAIHAHHK